MWRRVYVRLRSLWRWRRQEAELDEEIGFHLAAETDERIAEGMSPEDALSAARRDFGNATRIRELTREAWGWGAAERLLQDACAAVRMMRRNPGYTGAVVLTLALGIGLNAGMYGLLSRLFLQAPPHIEDPDGIHRVWVRERRFDGLLLASNRMNWLELTALRADTARLAAVAGATYPRAMPPWTGAGGRESPGLLGHRRALRAPRGSSRAREADRSRGRRPRGDAGRGDRRRLRAAAVRARPGGPRGNHQLRRRRLPDRRCAAAGLLRPRSECGGRLAAASARGAGQPGRHLEALSPSCPSCVSRPAWRRKQRAPPRPPPCARRAPTRRPHAARMRRRPRCWGPSCGPADRPASGRTCGCGCP